MAEKTQKRSVYTLEVPTWMDKAGLSKGLRHDRQHLGIILAAGSIFKIRKVSGDIDLKLNFLSSDRDIEGTVSVSEQWMNVSIDHILVPFVETPYTNSKITPIVEYEYSSGSKLLPVYEKHDSEPNFFTKWDKNDAEFALIESKYVRCLVPKIDKDILRYDDLGLDVLLDYYDRVFTFFNEMAGLSFEPFQATDRNLKNKYFLKADSSYDKSGNVIAYYWYPYSAVNGASIKDFWIKDTESNMVNLHEFGHGYEGKFMNTPGFSVNEVWNNFYMALYQNVHLGEKLWQEGWLYAYGNSEEVFAKLQSLLKDNTPLENWDIRSKCNFLMMLKDKGGDDAFPYLNQTYRRDVNSANYDPNRFNLLDRLSAAYSKISKIDITPFILRVGGILSKEQMEDNLLFQEKAVYPLCELVSSDELSHVQKTLCMKNPLTLVDPSILKQTRLVGDLSVKFIISNFSEIYGETFTLMSGQRYALQVKIKEHELKIPGIPIGVYTMILPTGKGTKYSIDKHYAVVKTGRNELEINFAPKNPKKYSHVLSEEFVFLGINNKNFGSVNVNYSSKTVDLSITNATPHENIKDEKYVQVTVKAGNGSVVFDRKIYGGETEISEDSIPFKLGYQIVIYHAEAKDRLVTKSNKESLLTSNNTNTLVLLASGLHNVEILDCNTGIFNKYAEVSEEISTAVAKIRANPKILYSKYSWQKDDIYLALKDYPGEDKAELMEKYKDVLPNENTLSESVGSTFLFEFLGYKDGLFFSVLVDFINNQITFTSNPVMPHKHDNGGIQASITFLDNNGIEGFRKDFVGDVKLKEESVTLPLSYFGGENLYIEHIEGKEHLVITNVTQNKRIMAKRYTVYSFVPTGIRIIHADDNHANPTIFHSIHAN